LRYLVCLYCVVTVDPRESGTTSSGSCYHSEHASDLTVASSSTSDYSKDTFETSSLSANEKGDLFNKRTKLSIKVHLKYDDLEFPKKIQVGDFSEFYASVFSALSNKKPGFKPCHPLQFQFGTKWYDFNEDTTFDDLCMDEDNPEISIKATSTPMDSALLGIYILIQYLGNYYK